MKRLPIGGAVVLLLAGCASPAVAPEQQTLGGTVTVFAAASLTESFDEIAAAFELAHPNVEVVLSYGGSSGLANQIVEGAPVDVFAAASPETMATVVDAGLARDPVDFAANGLEIAVPVGNPGDIEGIADFANPHLTLAVCAAEVPCGSAARQVFDALGLTAAPDTLEQDVKSVLTKVELGEVDAGLVYRTDVLAAGNAVEGIEFPEAAEAVNRYPIVALTEAGVAFVAWVLSDAGQTVLRKAGFGAP